MQLSSRLVRPSLFAVTVMALGLTGICVKRAYAAVTVPNHIQVTLGAPAGGVSGGVVFPEFNSPIKMSASCLTAPRGTASIHATFHAPSAAGPAAVTWSGTHAMPGALPIAGITGAVGADLVGVNLANSARLEIGPALNAVRIQNLAGAGAAVVLEQTW